MEQQGSPASQFFQSPAESLMSAPEDAYTSLFAATTPSAASTVNPMDMLTPKSYNDDSLLPMIKQEEGVASTPSPSPAPEKKTTKKRKSWGQVLPEPKTNLPPRKRAKTADEKEQRRVERVLRNRRAAQSSRERKRQEVEQLEKRNKDLEAAIQQAEQMNARLMDELAQMRKANGLPPLSQELFSPQTTHQPTETTVSPNATVDPMALSPCLSPVPEESEEILQQEPAKETILEQSENTSPDLTQLSHVGGGVEDVPVPVTHNLDSANIGLAPATSDDTLFSCGGSEFLSTSIDTDRYLIESGHLSSPFSSATDEPYLDFDTSPFNLDNSFNDELYNTFINDTDNGITAELQKPTDDAAAILSDEFRFYELENQVSSENPIQQPLPGASSNGCDVGGIASERETEDSRGQDELVRCFSEITLPSRELLLTLLWAIRTEEARIQREAGEVLDPETRSPLRVHQPSKKAALSVILEEENNRVQTL
ncbi:Transcriptional activator hac1 [Fusarium oxysporum f. sp. cubense race 1]|uniref:Transcriptional activator hac1 n=1 Tax=Fusarium oxysporum f. sp. cubense (strain race 1) TaxID=1229664 RepID=N4UNI9_FUSC1|nr:Transcriptional activator hac1 [Fusarium oxysporum f. sp. cubense race 1]